MPFGGGGGGSVVDQTLAQLQKADGAVAQWLLNDAVGSSTAVDTIGGFTATVHGTITFGQTGGDVSGAKAALFNGSTGFLSMHPTAPTVATGFTLEVAWLTTGLNTGGVFDSQPGTGNMRTETGSIEWHGGGTVPDVAYTVFGNSTNGVFALFHFEWTASGVNRTVGVYCNGQLMATRTTNGNQPVTFANPVQVGCLNGNTDFLAGTLQDLAFYNGTLTALQKQQHTAAYFGIPL
jgi:hypothetical protein